MLDLQPVLLTRAAEIAGGSERLCEYLGVSVDCFERWRTAHDRLPDDVFLKIVDMVLRDDMARATGDRRLHPRIGTEFGRGGEI